MRLDRILLHGTEIERVAMLCRGSGAKFAFPKVELRRSTVFHPHFPLNGRYGGLDLDFHSETRDNEHQLHAAIMSSWNGSYRIVGVRVSSSIVTRP